MSIPEALQIRLKNRQVVPFVGAGVSRSVQRLGTGGSAFPSWTELLERIAARLADTPQERKSAALMRAHLLEPADYLSAAAVARQCLTPEEWVSMIQSEIRVPRPQIEPRSLALASAIWSLGHFVITTNYDNVLEWASEAHHRNGPTTVSIQSSKSALIDALNDKVTSPTVWHIHGPPAGDGHGAQEERDPSALAAAGGN